MSQNRNPHLEKRCSRDGATIVRMSSLILSFSVYATTISEITSSRKYGLLTAVGSFACISSISHTSVLIPPSSSPQAEQRQSSSGSHISPCQPLFPEYHPSPLPTVLWDSTTTCYIFHLPINHIPSYHGVFSLYSLFLFCFPPDSMYPSSLSYDLTTVSILTPPWLHLPMFISCVSTFNLLVSVSALLYSSSHLAPTAHHLVSSIIHQTMSHPALSHLMLAFFSVHPVWMQGLNPKDQPCPCLHRCRVFPVVAFLLQSLSSMRQLSEIILERR